MRANSRARIGEEVLMSMMRAFSGPLQQSALPGYYLIDLGRSG